MTKVTIIFGKKEKDLPPRSNDLWDIDYQDIFNGTLEPREDVDYWFINGRLYEVERN